MKDYFEFKQEINELSLRRKKKAEPEMSNSKELKLKHGTGIYIKKVRAGTDIKKAFFDAVKASKVDREELQSYICNHVGFNPSIKVPHLCNTDF